LVSVYLPLANTNISGLFYFSAMILTQIVQVYWGFIHFLSSLASAQY
jgi:hypothetical protein